MRMRIRHAFRLALSREPTEREFSLLDDLYQDTLQLSRTSAQADADAPDVVACFAVARTIMNLEEFLARE
jgi:hypothetical protein